MSERLSVAHFGIDPLGLLRESEIEHLLDVWNRDRSSWCRVIRPPSISRPSLPEMPTAVPPRADALTIALLNAASSTNLDHLDRGLVGDIASSRRRSA